MYKLAPLLAAALLFSACNKNTGSGGPAGSPPSTEQDKTFYALGLLAGHSLASLKLSPDELAMTQRGIHDAATGATPEVSLEVYGPKVRSMAMQRTSAASAANAAAEKAKASVEEAKDAPYLAAAAKEQGAQAFPSGLVYKELTPGTGESPKPTDRVKVNYEGKLVDGTVFDSSYKRGQPATFGLNSVIPCWTEGLQKMKVGGTAQLVCPSSIAYRDMGHPPVIPGGAVLTFKVELLAIEAPGAMNMQPHMMGAPGMHQMMMPGGRPNIHLAPPQPK